MQFQIGWAGILLGKALKVHFILYNAVSQQNVNFKTEARRLTSVGP